MMEELVLVEGNFFSDFSGLSFFLLRRFFFLFNSKVFLVSRLNSPNVDIFLLLLLLLLPSLASSSRLRRVAANGEKGTRSLARLGSSSTHVKRVFNYRADGGERDQQSARRGREPKRRAENEILEPLAAARVKKKERGSRREGAKM
jgi:hypothetical protein